MVAGDVSVAITNNRGLACNMFDGVDDYVEIPHNANQLGANLSNGFTISAWINPRSLGENSLGWIIGKANGSTGSIGWYYNIQTGNTLSFRINVGTQSLSTNGSIVFGVWTHVLVTITSAQIASHYVNGALSGTPGDLVQGISAITTTNNMFIGNRFANGDRTWNGSIRSVKMWNRVLSTTEIANDYAGIGIPEGQILNVPLGGNYANGTNSGSVSTIVDDTIATAIKTQYSTAGKGISGAMMCICGSKSGQVITTAIQNK